VDVRVGHFQCPFAQEESVYDNATLSQHSDFLGDYAIHIRSSNILYNQAASQVEEL
jgi:hypothetical protein